MVSWLKKIRFQLFQNAKKFRNNGKTYPKNQFLSQLMIKQLNSNAVSKKHQQEQEISSLFLYQTYTPYEGLIGNISLKVMTYAPYCAQFTHHDREQNIFLSHNPYLSQQAFYHVSVLLSLSSYPLAFFPFCLSCTELVPALLTPLHKALTQGFFITFYNKSARRTVCRI